MTESGKLRAQLLLDVTFDLKSTSREEVLDSLHGIARFYHKRHAGIINSNAELEGFTYKLNELEPSKEKIEMQMATTGINTCECDDSWCPGWGIFYRDVDGVYDIQRCDTCKRFETDDDAYAYVRALEGCDTFRHMLAHKEELKAALSDGRRQSVVPFLEFLDYFESSIGLREAKTEEKSDDESTAG